MAHGVEKGLINEQGRDIRPGLHQLVNRVIATVPGEGAIYQRMAALQGPCPEPHPALTGYIANNLLTHIGDVRTELGRLGTTTLGIVNRPVLYDGQFRHLSFVTATGESDKEAANNMSGSVWVRDQAFIAKSLLEEAALTGNHSQIEQGKDLLKSLLFCMSTPTQTKRFDAVTAARGNVRPQEHPSIKFDLERDKEVPMPLLNLRTDWGHNQDAWQILAATSLEALDNGWLQKNDIAQYAQFFRRIPAFLHEVGYLNRESKGSWEEISAKGRLSTIAWEWTALTRMRKHADLFGFDEEARRLMDTMIQEGAETILERFPNEAAHFHAKDDPAYREEDAALIYLGLAQVPEQLAGLEGLGFAPVHFAANPKIAAAMKEGYPDPVDAMYKVMFDTMDRLKDPATGGYARYAGDSYQASNFWLPSVWENLAGQGGLWSAEEFKDRPGVIHFAGRNLMMEMVNHTINGDGKGVPTARWMHPNTQVAAVSFRRARQTEGRMKEWYAGHGLRDLKDALRMIAGENTYTIRPQNGTLEVVPMKPGTPPECVVVNLLADGSILTHPGPWGPLQWAGAGLRSALAWAECVN